MKLARLLVTSAAIIAVAACESGDPPLGPCERSFTVEAPDGTVTRELTEPDDNNNICIGGDDGVICGTAGLCDDGNACEISLVLPNAGGTGSYQAGETGDNDNAVFTVGWGDTPSGITKRSSSISGTVVVVEFDTQATGTFEGVGGLEGTADTAPTSAKFCTPSDLVR